MSLFKRVIGTDGDKIPLHLIHALVIEIINNRQTSSSTARILELNESEANDLEKILLILSSVTSKTKSSSRVFNYLMLGEIGITAPRDYTDESLLWQMAEAE